MTQQGLADAVGCSLSNLQYLESAAAKSVPFSRLGQLCDALGCAPGDLFVIDGVPSAAGAIDSLLSTAREAAGRLRPNEAIAALGEAEKLIKEKLAQA